MDGNIYISKLYIAKWMETWKNLCAGGIEKLQQQGLSII